MGESQQPDSSVCKCSAASGELRLALLPKSSDWRMQLEALSVVTWIREDIHHCSRW